MQYAKCKICRRLGEKLFLKGEKCFSPKCVMIKKAYPPGQKTRRRRRGVSEYGKELCEKQKLKNWYNLGERQFRGYVKQVLGHRAKGKDSSSILIGKLETRLDNVIFRLGFASSRAKARQLVSHGHFSVNDRRVNIPSYSVDKGDIVQVVSKVLPKIIEKHKPPKWLKFDVKKNKGEIVGAPTLEEAALPVEISAIFEYYSR